MTDVGIAMIRMALLGLVISLQGVLVACSTTGTGETQASSAQEQQSEAWVQFGVVFEVQAIDIDRDGRSGAGMRLEVVLDNGRSLVVEQLLSQAGELRVGDRVRVLQIGGYSRVTFWPYSTRDKAVEVE
jgi:outer membrane lipoprotein SlyB